MSFAAQSQIRRQHLPFALTWLQSACIIRNYGAMVSLRQGTNGCLVGNWQRGNNKVFRGRDFAPAEVDDDTSGGIRFRTFSVVICERISFRGVICFNQFDVVVTCDMTKYCVRKGIHRQLMTREVEIDGLHDCTISMCQIESTGIVKKPTANLHRFIDGQHGPEIIKRLNGRHRFGRSTLRNMR